MNGEPKNVIPVPRMTAGEAPLGKIYDVPIGYVLRADEHPWKYEIATLYPDGKIHGATPTDPTVSAVQSDIAKAQERIAVLESQIKAMQDAAAKEKTPPKAE